jgi:outer membrane protein
MKNSIRNTFLFLLLAACQNQQKFGYIDRSEVINNYEKKMAIEERFEIKNTQFINRRDSLIRQYESERQLAGQKARSMSPAQVQELSLEFQQKEVLLGQQIQAEQQELQQAFDAEIDSVIKQVKEYVIKYGKDHNYTFIFGTSDATNTVMYGSEAKDISQIILEQLNKDYQQKQ